MTTTTPSDDDEEEENTERRAAEWEALQAVYEGDEDISLFQQVDDDDKSTTHWTIQLGRTRLDLQLPRQYPAGVTTSPTVSVYAPHVSAARLQEITQELHDLWTPDTEIALMYTEHVRAAVEGQDFNTNEEDQVALSPMPQQSQDAPPPPPQPSSSTTTTITYIPPTAKYGQPIRTFDAHVVGNDTFRCTIFRGPAFHPPKSGPSESMVAFCAAVTCPEHVQWVWAELLLNSKMYDAKIAKATHNMVAYRYYHNRRREDQHDTAIQQPGLLLVSDNDDDGEKGSGAKLAALLELAAVDNVMVMVSRWYGGIHLGPARFKWIAHTARLALQEAGLIREK